MIVARAPLRITLGGGGTDLPSYYSEHGGFVISAAIDQYVYVTVHEAFEPAFILKYSKLERTTDIDAIEHPIFREALRLAGFAGIPGIEIASMADIPSGTGLGSSGTFTVALLKALHAFGRNLVHPVELAEQACRIEIDLLGEPVGKQDPYIASLGGLTCFGIGRDGQVAASPLRIPADARCELEENLLLFFTGYTRSASEILLDQKRRTDGLDSAMLDNLHFVKLLARETQQCLEAGNLARFAELLDVHWQNKKRRSPRMSNGCIDAIYEFARSNGALGGKVVGAGGGGFLMFYSEDKCRLRRAMKQRGVREVRFHFDDEGCKILAH